MDVSTCLIFPRFAIRAIMRYARYGRDGERTAMPMLDMQINRSRPSLTDRLFVVACRMIAILVLVAGLGYWSRVTGLSADPAARFDLYTPEWRALASSLAVLFPVAALGLWMATRWGLVVWITAVFAELFAYGLWSDVFGERPMVLTGHVLLLTVMLVLVVRLAIERRRMRLTHH